MLALKTDAGNSTALASAAITRMDDCNVRPLCIFSNSTLFLCSVDIVNSHQFISENLLIIFLYA